MKVIIQILSINSSSSGLNSSNLFEIAKNYISFHPTRKPRIRWMSTVLSISCRLHQGVNNISLRLPLGLLQPLKIIVRSTSLKYINFIKIQISFMKFQI